MSLFGFGEVRSDEPPASCAEPELFSGRPVCFPVAPPPGATVARRLVLGAPRSLMEEATKAMVQRCGRSGHPETKAQGTSASVLPLTTDRGM